MFNSCALFFLFLMVIRIGLFHLQIHSNNEILRSLIAFKWKESRFFAQQDFRIVFKCFSGIALSIEGFSLVGFYFKYPWLRSVSCNKCADKQLRWLSVARTWITLYPLLEITAFVPLNDAEQQGDINRRSN
jgi:hypothetical protein